MKIEAYLKGAGGILGSLRSFLGQLLKEGIVDYLLVPQEMSHRRTLTQTLITKPENLQGANPFSPVMPMNAASIVSKLTIDKPKRRLGAVLKPCEIRALIELVKLGKADLENLFIIGTDCLGTFEVDDYARYIDKLDGVEKDKGTPILIEMQKGATKSATQLSIPLRPACQMCDTMTPPIADIVLSGIEVNITRNPVFTFGVTFPEDPVQCIEQ